MTEASSLNPEIQGKIRQFTRVLMSYVDFREASGICSYVLIERLHDRPPKDRFLLQGLNSAMIIAYCRPFSSNDKGAETKIPSLPGRFLRDLSSDELELHKVVMEDRNTVLAHSDSVAWEPMVHILRYQGRDMLMPLWNDAHAPLTRDATERFGSLCEKLRECCFRERQRLEPELKPYLPVREIDGPELFLGDRARTGIRWL